MMERVARPRIEEASGARVRSLLARPVELARPSALALIAVLSLAPSLASPARAQVEGGAEASARESTLGPVSARVRVEPASPTIGDPIRFELEVTAEPGVELLMPEFGEALSAFQISDFVPIEEIDDAGRTVALQRYTLQAFRSGPSRIPPIAVEFVDRREGQQPAPDDQDAYELLTEPVDLEIASVLTEDAPLELRPAAGELPPLSTGGGTAVLLGLFALAGVAGVFAARLWLARGRAEAERSAFEIAMGELEELLAGDRPSGDRLDPFFVKLSGIVRRYLERRFDLRSPELTTEEFLGVVSKSPDLSRDHQTLLRDFLQRADLVKFAHHIPDSETVEASIDSARRFLEETRERPAEAA